MNPHPSHKLKTINVVRNFQILYCDYCGIFATHPEIEQPCKRKADLLTKVQRREDLQSEYAMWKSGRWNSTQPLEDKRA